MSPNWICAFSVENVSGICLCMPKSGSFSNCFGCRWRQCLHGCQSRKVWRNSFDAWVLLAFLSASVRSGQPSARGEAIRKCVLWPDFLDSYHSLVIDLCDRFLSTSHQRKPLKELFCSLLAYKDNLAPDKWPCHALATKGMYDSIRLTCCTYLCW